MSATSVLHRPLRRRPAVAPAVIRWSTGSTTAQMIAAAPAKLEPVAPEQSTEALSEREQILAALGFALHHLTEPLGSAATMLDMHRATAVLTRQIAAALETGDAVDSVARLLTDPARTAMPDGRTAHEFCGPTWHHVSAVSTERVTAALAGVDRYGPRVVARLACIRGLQATAPWWGTSLWAEHAERWFAEHRMAPRLKSALLRRPERVDDAIVADILNRALAGDAVRQAG